MGGPFWSREEEDALKILSENKTPLFEVARVIRRSPEAIRRKAVMLGLTLGAGAPPVDYEALQSILQLRKG